MTIDDYINSPDALFHYTKLVTAIEHILPTKKLKLSLLKDTNDPREYKFKFFGVMGEPLDKETTRSLSSKAHTVIDRILRYECRTLCFCTNEKPNLILENHNSIEDEHAHSEGWNKSRMWSQYGQGHHGICLVFSKNKLIELLKKSKAHIKDYKASNVKYSQQQRLRNKTINFDGNRLEEEGVEEYSYNHVIENSKELLFQKNIDYRDETEFRVIAFDPDKKLEYIDIGSIIKCVIVGDRTPEVYFPLINKKCADINIESRKASWHGGGFRLGPCRESDS